MQAETDLLNVYIVLHFKPLAGLRLQLIAALHCLIRAVLNCRAGYALI